VPAETAPTGLAPDPREYRRRLDRQSDDQIDAWAMELMRDLSIRKGVRHVVAGFMEAARLDERGLERVFSAGGGPIATLGRTDEFFTGTAEGTLAHLRAKIVGRALIDGGGRRPLLIHHHPTDRIFRHYVPPYSPSPTLRSSPPMGRDKGGGIYRHG